MDATKAIAVMVTNDGGCWDYTNSENVLEMSNRKKE